jgi:putative endonuclease
MFFVYIIYSHELDRFYIGQCQDLQRRLADHNNSRSTYTKRGKPWILKWSMEFPTREEAIAEELRIKKKKSRNYIEWLISSAC